jgi:hypothetical protein
VVVGREAPKAHNQLHLVVVDLFELADLLVMDNPGKVFLGLNFVPPVLYLIGVEAILHIINSLDLLQPYFFLVHVSHIFGNLKTDPHRHVHFVVLLPQFLHKFIVFRVQRFLELLQLVYAPVYLHQFVEDRSEIVVY